MTEPKYTKESLQELSVEDIVPIHNHFAEKSGLELVENFASHEEAVHQTLIAIEKFEDTEHTATLKVIKALLPSEPKKLTESLYRTIKIVRSPVEGEFSKRFDRYKDGMSLLDIIRTEGVCRADVYAYVKQGNMTLSDSFLKQKPVVSKKKKAVEETETTVTSSEELVSGDFTPEEVVG